MTDEPEIKASAETIRSVATALGRARLFDDKLGGSDEGRIAAWAEAADPHQLSKEDMLAAVTAYYGAVSGRAMQVADLISYGRQIRRDRGMEEPDAARDARQKALEAKVREDVAELAASKAVEAKYTRPESMGALGVRCPWCRAGVGQRCVVPRTDKPLTKVRFHPARTEALTKGGKQ